MNIQKKDLNNTNEKQNNNVINFTELFCFFDIKLHISTNSAKNTVYNKKEVIEMNIVENGVKVDFHIHSVASKHKEGSGKVDNSTIVNLSVLIQK